MKRTQRSSSPTGRHGQQQRTEPRGSFFRATTRSKGTGFSQSSSCILCWAISTTINWAYPQIGNFEREKGLRWLSFVCACR